MSRRPSTLELVLIALIALRLVLLFTSNDRAGLTVTLGGPAPDSRPLEQRLQAAPTPKPPAVRKGRQHSRAEASPPPQPHAHVPSRRRRANSWQPSAVASDDAPLPARDEPPLPVNGLTDGALAASEREYRGCCARAWRDPSESVATEYCDEEAGGDDEADRPSSRFTCYSAPTGGGSAEGRRNPGTGGTWYCEARGLVVNTSAIAIGSDDLSIPTSSQKGLWGRRALLLGCQLKVRVRRTRSVGEKRWLRQCALIALGVSSG